MRREGGDDDGEANGRPCGRGSHLAALRHGHSGKERPRSVRHACRELGGDNFFVSASGCRRRARSLALRRLALHQARPLQYPHT